MAVSKIILPQASDYYKNLCKCCLDTAYCSDSLPEDERFNTLLSLQDDIESLISFRNSKSERNLNIFMDRIGLVDAPRKTLQEIGDEYGITRERVRQICTKVERSVCRKDPVFLQFHEHAFSLIQNWTPEQFYDFMFGNVTPYWGKTFTVTVIDLLFGIKEITNLLDKYKAWISLKGTVIKDIRKNQRYEVKIRNSIHFPGPHIPNNMSISGLQPLRNVNESISHISGKIHLSKSHRELEYESQIELNVLTLLNDCPWITEINSQCIAIPYMFDGIEHTYYPDVIIKTQDDDVCIIEVKPLMHMSLYSNIVKFRALHMYCRKYGYGYAVVNQSFKSFQDILSTKYNEKFAKELVAQCAVHSFLNWGDILRIAAKDKVDITVMEFGSLIVNEKLKLSLKPFRVSLQ